MQRAKKNYLIYVIMLLLFGALIYMAIEEGDRFSHHVVASSAVAEETPFAMFCQFVTDNLHHPLSILLIQIIAVLLMVRLFGFLFKHIGQPGVIGEIVAGIVLGPSVLGYFFPDVFQALFPPESLTNLELLSQVGLVLFMFVIGMELDFSVLKTRSTKHWSSAMQVYWFRSSSASSHLIGFMKNMPLPRQVSCRLPFSSVSL